MTVDAFFELFLEELKQNNNLQSYYKFLNTKSGFYFRKAYFVQRLQYIYNNVQAGKKIWDCGCGYGTTGLFLAMNGIASSGTTIEFYFQQIAQRKEYWKQYGNVDLFKATHENIFDNKPADNSIDIIILQDTLHHLEPLQDALKIMKDTLKSNGEIILIEENGNNIIQNTKLYIRRGNKRIIKIWDEQLQKHVLLGNENIRSLANWKNEFSKQDMLIEDSKTQYLRYYLPFNFNSNNFDDKIKKEQEIWKHNNFLKEYFFFGLNFIVKKDRY